MKHDELHNCPDDLYVCIAKNISTESEGVINREAENILTLNYLIPTLILSSGYGGVVINSDIWTIFRQAFFFI